MLQSSTLRFLKNLDKHNEKTWFEKKRSAYEDAKADFAGFIQNVINKHGRKDETISQLAAKDCTFRINRDVRFSKDKSPYKNNFGAYINRGGKKSIYAGYYFHCQPGESFVGGGLWVPMPPNLKKVRQEIDYCFDEFSTVLSSKTFKTTYGDLERTGDLSLARLPQGFEKDNPAAAYIKLKSFIAMKKLDDETLQSKDLVKITVSAFEALQPLLEFLNRPLHE